MNRAQSFSARLSFFFILGFYTLQIHSQELVFRHYGAAEGFPSSETYCVIQDSSGYMWFGTDRGLVKFNGYSFTNFTSADGLPDNTLFGLSMDHHRRIWLSTYAGRTGYILEGKPRMYAYNNLVKSLVGAGISNGIYHDRKDRLWVGHAHPHNESRQVHYIDAAGRVHAPPLLPELGYSDIYLTRPCLVNVNPGATKVRIISAETDQVLFQLPLEDTVQHPVFGYTESDGTQWLCINGHVWSFRKDKITRHADYTGKLLSFMVDEQKNLWLGFLGKGLLLYLASKNYQHPLTLLPDLSVSGMHLDREKGKWFTTLENGVFYLSPGLCFSYSLKSGLLSAKVLQLDYFNGNVLAVQSDFNASVKKKNAQTFSRINSPGSEVYKIKKGTADTFYYSSWKPVRFSMPGKFINVLHQKICFGEQKIWSFTGSEIRCFSTKGELKKLVSVAPLIGTCLFERKAEQNFLIGTVEGLYEYRNEKLQDLSLLNPLLKTRISGIVRLRDSILAIATIGQGLLLVHESNFSAIEHYTAGNGLPSAMCNTLLKQNDSVLWIGTNKGLCRIVYPGNHRVSRFQIIDAHNGLASNEITDLCAAGNDLWVATQNGISVLQYAGAAEVVMQPPLLIENVLVNGSSISPLSENIFSFKQNNIAVSFMGLNYQHPGELLYRYRLIGADSTWKITPNCSILFSALMPGSYLFELQVIGYNGHLFDAKRSLSFTILPPYWKSWWFAAILLILLTLGIYIFVVRRIGFVKKQAKLRHALDLYRNKALRAQMNPHFIYNSMNAIQNYVTKSDTNASIDFLTRFSRLMRLTFQNSFTELVLLEKDLEALLLYTEMESIRFPGKFRFELFTDETIRPDLLQVPPLLMQPFVENAILHAFVGKQDIGCIRLGICQRRNRLYFAVSDNGIGRSEALLYQKKKEKYRQAEERKESGITITAERISLVWGKNYDNDFFKITDIFDADGKAAGTLVEFYLPLNYDQTSFSG